MKNSTVPVIYLLLSMLWTTGCREQPAFVDLFSGTSPATEVTVDDASEIYEPAAVFIRIMNNKLEYHNTSFDYEITEENDRTITMQANLAINGGLEVESMTYNRMDETLMLTLVNSDETILLEKYDRMIERKRSEFMEVPLTSDISRLSGNQKELLKRLFEVADIMEEIYWLQVFPEKETVLENILDDNLEEFFRINYGPWERLNGNLPFMPDYGEKPAGSGFYPPDMSKEEFENLDDERKTSLYTLLKRDENGTLMVVPYHVAYKLLLEKASGILVQAASLAENEGFKRYLELLSKAFLSDDFMASDMAWMDMKNNDIDFIAGPIENYEDRLYNYKAAFESFILVRDPVWSEKLNYIAALLPELQKNLPVPEAYKREVPGSNSDLGVYDAVYYAGDCNAGSKTIAINLPNNEQVQAEKGSRKLQLKNAIRYKFEQILVPISNVLIDEEQRGHIKFDAFFENVMYHEVGHGLGINQTINGRGTVREALRDQSTAIEEGKADILGLYLVTKLHEMGVTKSDLMDNYVTFMAGIFRSVRFGAASSHGKANMIRFNYFQEKGAFTRNPETGTYRVDFEKMQDAMNSLAEMILTIQGNGDYEAAKKLVDKKGFIGEELQGDLDKLRESNIPVDIVFEQGPHLLGL
ncbi:MAG: Zn-dependent hydrolase [Bacteroidales bacterium]|nr:Zn-dependent hydrolase [Bacteroidales bacterium]MBN2697287.1 Zn-dependent hydrolase [Bacteroidales bacterium]